MGEVGWDGGKGGGGEGGGVVIVGGWSPALASDIGPLPANAGRHESSESLEIVFGH